MTSLTWEDLVGDVTPKAPPSKEPEHILVLSYDADGEPEYELEHPDGCPTVLRYDGEVVDYTCAAGSCVTDSGLDYYFPAKPEDAHAYGEQLAIPGRYVVEFWTATYRGFDYTEFDAGLRLVYPEEGA